MIKRRHYVVILNETVYHSLLASQCLFFLIISAVFPLKSFLNAGPNKTFPGK